MNIRKMDLVVALYIFGVITAEVLGTKTFPLFNFGWLHLAVPVAVFVMPLLFTLIDSVVEVYGRNRATSIVYCGLITIALLILYATLATHLPPSARSKATESAYDTVFKSSVRISLASLVAFATSEISDVIIFSKLRQRLNGRALWLRNNLTNFISQFADTVVFLTLAFYAVHLPFGSNASFLWGLILPYWLIRCGLSVIETPLVYAGVWWLRKDPESPKV